MVLEIWWPTSCIKSFRSFGTLVVALGGVLKLFPVALLSMMVLVSPQLWGMPRNSDIPTLKSFSAWKSEKVQSVKEQVSDVRNKFQLVKARVKSTQDPQLNVVSQQLNQQEWNLEVAQDLNVIDYVVLYLAAQGSKADLKAAATKFTPEETAQILAAYIKMIHVHQTDAHVSSGPRYMDSKD
jgi:hypothetical protein